MKWLRTERFSNRKCGHLMSRLGSHKFYILTFRGQKQDKSLDCPNNDPFIIHKPLPRINLRGCQHIPVSSYNMHTSHAPTTHVCLWWMGFFLSLGHTVGLDGCKASHTMYLDLHNIQDGGLVPGKPHQVVVYIVYSKAIHWKSSKHGVLYLVCVDHDECMQSHTYTCTFNL